MWKYILKRIALLIPMFFGISFIIFTIMALTPGDSATMILGSNASNEALEALREELGYNQPFLIRYFSYITQGSFGNSYITGLPVFTGIFAKFPVTLTLALSSIFLALIVGIPLGIISAIR